MLPLDRQNRYRARYAREHPGWRSSGAELEALVRGHLRPDGHVLDVGCGRGGVMELFWRAVALAVGLDPDPASLREQRTGMPAAAGLAEALPFADQTFDLAIAVWVLEHLPRPEAAVREVGRVLKPGGRFVFLTPNAWHPLVRANRAGQLWPRLQRALVPALYGRSADDTFRVYYRANTPARLAALAAAGGFQAAALRAIGDPTYLAFNDPLYHFSVAGERWLPARWRVHLLGDWVKAG